MRYHKDTPPPLQPCVPILTALVPRAGVPDPTSVRMFSIVLWGNNDNAIVVNTAAMNNNAQYSSPVKDKLLPDFPVPPGASTPPVLVLDLEGTLLGTIYTRKNG